MNPNGSSRAPLTSDNSFDDHHPAFSPDGTKIAFISSSFDDEEGIGSYEDVYIMNADGSGRTELTHDTWEEGHSDGAPVFSPDGTKIAFSRADQGICIMDVDGTDVDCLAWGGDPSFSPDGSKIVFSKNVQAPNGFHHVDIWVMNADGTGQTSLFSNVTSNDTAPSFSPDGSKIVFVRAGDTADQDIWVMNADGSFPTPLMVDEPPGDPNGGPQDFDPSFSPSGSKIVFARGDHDWNDEGIYTMNADGTGTARLTHNGEDSSPTYSPSGAKIAFTGMELTNSLLAQHAPELRYDILETYRADAADTITDNYVNEGGETVRSNYLNNEAGDHIAASDPELPEDQLSLYFLAPQYYHPWSCCPEAGGDYFGDAVSTDRIDEANDTVEHTYASDAQRMHGDSFYADVTYARAVPDLVTGGWTLQYWLFYYYNPKTYVWYGAHEGDWELVQVHLGSDLQPTAATYAQHGWGESCEWSHVQRNTSGQPIVYVAEGSHASYFSSGYHVNPNPENPLEPADDEAGGNGDVVTPEVRNISGEPQGWLLWPGRWGGSTGVADSPKGPKFQGGYKWDDPAAWSVGVKDCTEEQVQGASSKRLGSWSVGASPPASPPLPSVTVRRVGNRAVFRYRFDHMPEGSRRRPWMLLTSVDSRGKKYPPLTTRTRIRDAKGVIRQPLGFGRPPFRARVSVLARSGARSRTVGLRLGRLPRSLTR